MKALGSIITSAFLSASNSPLYSQVITNPLFREEEQHTSSSLKVSKGHSRVSHADIKQPVKATIHMSGSQSYHVAQSAQTNAYNISVTITDDLSMKYQTPSYKFGFMAEVRRNMSRITEPSEQIEYEPPLFDPLKPSKRDIYRSPRYSSASFKQKIRQIKK